MEMQIIAIYFICDELTKQSGIADDPQSQMTTNAVIINAYLAFAISQKR